MKVIPDIEAATHRELYRLILALALPALAENLLNTLVSMVDTMMVSGYSATAVAAIGLTTQLRMLMLSVFMSLGIGCTALISRAKGMNAPEKATHVFMQTLSLTALVTLGVIAVMLPSLQPLLRLLSGGELSDQVMEMAEQYFIIQIYGIPLLSFTYVINAALRGVGNTRIAFYTSMASNVVNVFFNYCLISGHLGFPALGVVGASIATVIGQGVALAGSTLTLLRGKQFIRLKLRKALPLDRAILSGIALVAVPSLLEQIIMRLGMMLFTRIVTSLGDAEYTIHIIAMNIQSLLLTTGMAFGVAASTLTGQCLGRRNPSRARELVRQTLHLNLAVSVLVALLLIFCGRPLVSLYSPEARVQEVAASLLRIVALTNPLSNARFVYNNALRGAGDSRFTAVSTLAGVLVARPLLAAVLVYGLHLGLTGVWLALVSDAVICYALGNRRWHSTKWEGIRLMGEQAEA